MNQQPTVQRSGGSLKWLLLILVLLILAGAAYYYYVVYYNKGAATPTASASPTVVTPSPAPSNSAEETSVRQTLDGFFKAFLAKNVETMNTFLTTEAQITSKTNPQELLTYNSLPAQGYKIIDVTKNGVAYTADVILFIYNGEPGPTNPEAGTSWKLAEYRTYNIIKQNGKWLIDVPTIFHQ